MNPIEAVVSKHSVQAKSWNEDDIEGYANETLLLDGTNSEVEDLFNILKTPRKACAYVNVDGKDFIAWCESEIDEPEMMKAIIFKYCEINLDKRCRSVEVIELVITGRPMFEMA